MRIPKSLRRERTTFTLELKNPTVTILACQLRSIHFWGELKESQHSSRLSVRQKRTQSAQSELPYIQSLLLQVCSDACSAGNLVFFQHKIIIVS